VRTKKTLLWILFFLFTGLIVLPDPVDGVPGPVDDIVYGILDLVVVAVLGGIRRGKPKAALAAKPAGTKAPP
jgi:hypothetical protein